MTITRYNQDQFHIEHKVKEELSLENRCMARYHSTNILSNLVSGWNLMAIEFALFSS